MKLKFKHQPYQAAAVDAVVDCFVGQPKQSMVAYRIDPGRGTNNGQQEMLDDGFKNSGIAVPKQQLLENIRTVQRTIIVPVERTITYEAPFTRSDRETDYQTVSTYLDEHPGHG